jgi:two-component system response regulator AlgR
VREIGRDGEPPVCVAGEAAQAQAAIDWLAHHEADVLLLDIQMPGLDGVSLAARLLELPRPPAVVFVTAHAEHALRAFELEAADYLTKPVRRERPAGGAGARRPTAGSRGRHAAGRGPVIVVSERGRLVRVPLAEVLYLKAELKYVTLRTAQHSYVLDDALSDLEQRLGERFLRVHRNAVVAKAAVRALERHASDEEGAEGWAVRWPRPTSGSRCRAARSRRCARRWRPAGSEPGRRAVARRAGRPASGRRASLSFRTAALHAARCDGAARAVPDTSHTAPRQARRRRLG